MEIIMSAEQKKKRLKNSKQRLWDLWVPTYALWYSKREKSQVAGQREYLKK